jgi:hypothetical protein
VQSSSVQRLSIEGFPAVILPTLTQGLSFKALQVARDPAYKYHQGNDHPPNLALQLTAVIQIQALQQIKTDAFDL